MAGIWISLILSFLLIVLFPLLFGQLLAASMAKLHLDPTTGLFVTLAIILGSFINIPVKRIERTRDVVVHPLATFGFFRFWPELRRVRQATVIAVNLGGCVVPTAVAVYELIRLAELDGHMLWAVPVTAVVNIAVCYAVARPVEGVGIALPGLIPAITAAAAALVLAPDQAPPVAFIAGVAGPLIGADLLHLKDVEKIASGVLSIGGAGTFDGIVLSGIVAAYLA